MSTAAHINAPNGVGLLFHQAARHGDWSGGDATPMSPDFKMISQYSKAHTRISIVTVPANSQDGFISICHQLTVIILCNVLQTEALSLAAQECLGNYVNSKREKICHKTVLFMKAQEGRHTPLYNWLNRVSLSRTRV